MSNAVDKYFDSIHSVLSAIRASEQEAISKVADIGAECVKKGGVLQVFDTGHMLSSELIGRAGGLLAWTPLSFSVNVNNPSRHRDRDPAPKPDDLPAVVAICFGRSNLRQGDVLFVGSVSGKTPMPVEVALQGKSFGATVVALTSVEHSSLLASEHPSGKRLFEVADLVLDNHAPPGDAMLTLEGSSRAVCPASGIAAAVTMWAVNAAIIEKLITQGIEPSIYRSVNLPGGPEDVRETEAKYAERGF